MSNNGGIFLPPPFMLPSNNKTTELFFDHSPPASHSKVTKYTSLASLFFFFFPVFLWPHPRHKDVPRLGVELELQLTATATATSTATARSELHLRPTLQLMAMSDHLTHWARPRIEPVSSWILVGFAATEPRWEFLSSCLVPQGQQHNWTFMSTLHPLLLQDHSLRVTVPLLLPPFGLHFLCKISKHFGFSELSLPLSY